ncbi:ATP-dependent DNA helicase DinG [Bowdeniella nasicola]|uniref:DNA 5'-3' helicase n=1 Tax=Bowdeniella nasicola TaxID=208480 RepID=A0A1H4BBK7_9ACTO|nr:ATP-dependent DNA helicase [Bowdeniella nasicola]SEA45543.1 ATP-dependent DNA helicase DinG [Bowdeniella nasicola]
MTGQDPAELTARALSAAVADLGGEPRPGQSAMAKRVIETLSEGHLALIQAGTGTGKSLGYLVPAMTALATGEASRVVVATATLALQRQILIKDAPLAAEAVRATTGSAITVAVQKGWHHYVCLHKLNGGYPDEGETLFTEDDTAAAAGTLGDQILRLREFAKESDTGDRDDVTPGVHDRAWRQVSVSRQECLGSRCELFEDCFAVRARARAAEADLVVTNHTLLGIQAASEVPVLPEFDALIVDEAHDLVSRVTQAGTLQISGAMLARLHRTAAREFPTTHLDDAVAAVEEAIEEAPAGRLRALSPALHDAFLLLGSAASEASEAGRTDSVTTGARRTADPEATGARAQAKAALLELSEMAVRVLSDSIAAGADVAWIDRGRDGSEAPRLNISPLDVAPLIANELLAERGAVLTSATLSLGGSFAAAKAEVGAHLLANHTVTDLDVGSPFNYPKQGIIYIATHVPRPDRDGISEEALDVMAELVEASGGGTLGLFSSRRGAERAAERLRVSIDTPVYVQGEGQLSQLVDDFLADESASLLGTLSLWQGVDAPGTTCRLVVIDRIPFPRPDDPMIEARNELATSRRQNAFMTVSATHAALMLAQGSGRLIRTHSDRGVVAVLDPRLKIARYGGFLAASMPQMWPTSETRLVKNALARLREQAG